MNKRVYGLDIVRAVAILTIIWAHGIILFGISPYNHYSIGDGVNIFFVLSGFLIGTILLKIINKPGFKLTDLRNFWFRRWMRTLPAYFFVLTLLVAYSLYQGKLADYYKYYLFIQAFFYGKAPLYYESWSLCVEEWFYLLTPLLLAFAVRFNKLLLCIISIIIVSSVFGIIRASQASSVIQWNLWVRQATVYRFDSIMWGVLAAYLVYYKKIQGKQIFFLIGIIAFIGTTIYEDIGSFGPFVKYWLLPVQSISVFLCIPYLNRIKTGQGVFYRFLTFTSKVSYSMYLICLTPFQIINEHLFYRTHGLPINTQHLVSLAAYLLVVFGGSYLMYRFIEKPFMDLREKRSSKIILSEVAG